MKPNENGSYVITEQGDLGLGLTAVTKSEIRRNDQDEKKEEKDSNGLFYK